LKNKFSRKSYTEFKEGAFFGPKIRELVHDEKCEDHLSGKKQHGIFFFRKVPIIW
jgi:hypothetical protein